jgi:hypothetical protein
MIPSPILAEQSIKVLFRVLSYLFSLVNLFIVLLPAVTMAPPQIWLVLVGIDFYPEEAERLLGSVNDVKEIESIMNRYYKNVNTIRLEAAISEDPKQTLPLGPESSWPTRDNFVSSLESIAQKASSSDIVYVHFSGHGALESTAFSKLGYRENYGTDAALVLLEPKGSAKTRYLYGIELSVLLDKIATKVLRLMVVLDACHSGSISRNEGHGVRGIPWNAKVDAAFPREFPTPKPDVSRNATLESHWLLQPRGYTLLAACGPHEKAKELRFGSSHHGALSFFLMEALDFCIQKQVEEVTSELLYKRLRAKMYFKLPEQHPVLIGTENISLLGVEMKDRPERHTGEVIKVTQDGEVWLNVGLIHGVRVDDEYSVYSHNEATDLVCRVKVTDVQAVHSVTRQVDGDTSQTGSPAKVGYYVSLIALARPLAHVKLWAGADKAWEEMIERSTWLRVLSREEPFPIDIPSFSVVIENKSHYSILDSKGCPITNLPLVALSSPHARSEIYRILEHLAKYSFVEMLENRRIDDLLDTEFSISVKSETDLHSPLNSDLNTSVQDGSKIEIILRNLCNETLYFAILNLTALKKVKHIYPRHKSNQAILPCDPQDFFPKGAREPVARQGMIRLSPRMSVPERLKTTQTEIRVNDVLKFLVSTHPGLEARIMELPDIWENVTKDEAASKMSDEAFNPQVDTTFTGAGDEAGALRGDSKQVRWACRSIRVQIMREPTKASEAQ